MYRRFQGCWVALSDRQMEDVEKTKREGYEGSS